MQFDVPDFFHGHRINAVGIRSDRPEVAVDVQSMTNSNSPPPRRVVDQILGNRRPSCQTGIHHVEVSATQTFPASLVVEHVPGNSVDTVGQSRRVDVEEAHPALAVLVTREQCGYVVAEVVVDCMSGHHAIDHYGDARSIGGYQAWLRCQGPTEVDIVRSHNRTTRRWRIDSAK